MAEVVLNLTGQLSKVQVVSGVTAADIGKVNGDWAVVTVKRGKDKFLWSATHLEGTVAYQTIATVSLSGTPVVGCYLNDRYVAASHAKTTSGGVVTMYGLDFAKKISLPRGALAVRCGGSQDGASSVFYLNQNSRTGTLTVAAKQDGKVVLTSPRINPRFRDVVLGLIPTGVGQSATAVIAARSSSKPVLQVLTAANKWRTLSLPAIERGRAITAAVGVRRGDQTYIVLQLTNRSKATSYIKVVIPNSFL